MGGVLYFTIRVVANGGSPMSMRREWYAVSLIVLSGILYGFLGYFGTQLLKDDFTVTSMLFWRFFIATLWMLAYSSWRQKKISLPKPDFQIYLLPFILGALFYSGSSAFYFMASKHTGTGLAMVIFFCYPMFVALFAWLKKEREIGKLTLFSLLIIVVGLFLLKGNDANPVNAVGIILAIASAVCYAVYVYKSKHILDRMGTMHFTTVVCISCTAMFLAIAYATHTFVTPSSLIDWCSAIAVGVFATAIPIQLLLEGLKIINPLKASILSVLEPVVTIIVGVILLHESVSMLQTLGILTVISGAILIQFTRE